MDTFLWLPATCIWPPATYWPPVYGPRPPVYGHRPPVYGHRPPVLWPPVALQKVITASGIRTHDLRFSSPMLSPLRCSDSLLQCYVMAGYHSWSGHWPPGHRPPGHRPPPNTGGHLATRPPATSQTGGHLATRPPATSKISGHLATRPPATSQTGGLLATWPPATSGHRWPVAGVPDSGHRPLVAWPAMIGTVDHLRKAIHRSNVAQYVSQPHQIYFTS